MSLGATGAGDRTSRVETGSSDELREQAIASLRKKREFRSHLLTYLAVNAMLILIWALTDGGFFWPIFPILGWAIFGLIPHAYEVYYRKPFSEDQIRREAERLRR